MQIVLHVFITVSIYRFPKEIAYKKAHCTIVLSWNSVAIIYTSWHLGFPILIKLIIFEFSPWLFDFIDGEKIKIPYHMNVFKHIQHSSKTRTISPEFESNLQVLLIELKLKLI